MTGAGKRRRQLTFNSVEAVLIAAAFALAGALLLRAYQQYRQNGAFAVELAGQVPVIEALYAELQPVTLANCTLERLGEANDGGYLVCGNLLGGVSAGYSYGISGYDGWGCDISRRLNVPVHQYDCFDLRAPSCEGGVTHFHPECVAATSYRDGSDRPFDTVSAHLAVNGDSARQVILKIDVEGAEWDVFAQMDDDTLAAIDQLVVEFHGVRQARFLAVVRKLKEHFEVAHLHYNNAACAEYSAPHPAFAYEVLLVSKRLAVVDRKAAVAARPGPLDALNYPSLPDCQN